MHFHANKILIAMTLAALAASAQATPIYDMLPMLYAPLPGGELPRRSVEPPLPLPAQRADWLTACAAALAFWQSAARDTRLSAGFARECAGVATRLEDIAQRL